MSSFWIEVILGLLAAIVSILVIRQIYPNKDHAFWRAGLVIAAVIYVGFYFFGGSIQWILTELGGVALYLGFAILSKRYSLLFLALGWEVHVLWDVLLHAGGEPTFVPAWYPGVCLGFDIAIAGYVVWLKRRRGAGEAPRMAVS